MSDDLRRCITCLGRTDPGRFRCDDCQSNADRRPPLRLVTLPGIDADQLAADSRRRHPSNTDANDE